MNEVATATDTAVEDPSESVGEADVGIDDDSDEDSGDDAVLDIRLSPLSPSSPAAPDIDDVAELERLLAHERSVVERLEGDLEAARSEHRLELVPTAVLREREHRERDAIERVSNAEGRWYELTIQLQRERDRTDSYARELERVRAVLTSRQRRKLGIE